MKAILTLIDGKVDIEGSKVDMAAAGNRTVALFIWGKVLSRHDLGEVPAGAQIFRWDMSTKLPDIRSICGGIIDLHRPKLKWQWLYRLGDQKRTRITEDPYPDAYTAEEAMSIVFPPPIQITILRKVLESEVSG